MADDRTTVHYLAAHVLVEVFDFLDKEGKTYHMTVDSGGVDFIGLALQVDDTEIDRLNIRMRVHFDGRPPLIHADGDVILPVREPYTVLCRTEGRETTWIDTVRATNADHAKFLARVQCGLAWRIPSADVEVLGVFKGEVEVADWNDSVIA